MYTLIKTKTYLKGEKKYASAIGKRRLEKMEQHLAEKPTSDPVHIVKMEGEDAMYRYSIGDFRVIYEVFESEVEVLLIKLGPRGSIYQDFN